LLLEELATVVKCTPYFEACSLNKAMICF
jgi:hypothetical protein